MYHLSLIFIRAQFEESKTTSWLRAENLDLYRSTSISNFSRGGLNSKSHRFTWHILNQQAFMNAKAFLLNVTVPFPSTLFLKFIVTCGN